MTARALYCCHVVHSAGNDGNTEWRFLTLCPQVLQVLKECLWEAFHPSKQAGRISVISFTFRAQHDALAYTKLEWLFYGIFLFTLRAQSDALTYTKLEWFFYCIFLFTLRVQLDAPTYTLTTDQCGARSGSSQ